MGSSRNIKGPPASEVWRWRSARPSNPVTPPAGRARQGSHHSYNRPPRAIGAATDHMPAHRRPTSRHSSPYQVDRVTNTRCTRDRRRVSYRPMDSFRIDEIARRLLERVPPALRSMQQDLESNFRAVLRERLSKLDLVSRDEFDAQTRVLERTRARLEALEARLASLEGSGSAVGNAPGSGLPPA